MKFGKEFAAQMVQEWREAYMEYNNLKKILKEILNFRKRNAPSPIAATSSSRGGLKRRVSLYRAFSGLTSKYRDYSPRKSDGHDQEDEVILVSSVQEEEGMKEGKYQTMFLNASEEGGESELVFFRRLDDEFNKVIGFYRKKVQEVVVEAEDLSKQMDALIALRIKVENPVMGGADHVVNLAGNGVSSVDDDVPIHGKHQGWSQMEVIQEVEMSTLNTGGFRPASLEVLGRIKKNFKPETPVSTMKNIILSSKSDFSYSEVELRRAEQQLAQAFIEFYQKLLLLKSYCFLNQLAFSKIMKKYDKVTSRHASRAYLRMVESSDLGSSDEVTRLIERVEITFVKHFSNGNQSKGMAKLRPKDKKEKHTLTFSLGFFVGCSAALLIALVMNMHARDILDSLGGPRYMDNIFPLYSLFGFIVLHMIMYGANIYFWKRFRINYTFIFGFKKGTELGYREVLLLSAGLAVLTFGAVLLNLDMEMDPRTQSFQAETELVPLALLTLLLLVILCPFNVMYRSSRYFLIKSVLHCLFAPLYKVTLPDFFLADQLTSQMQGFRNLEFYVCYYGWGDFKKRSNNCSANKVYEAFYFLVAMIPYWVRLLQCIRRLFEEKDAMQGYNGLKYLTVLIAVAMKTTYDLKKGMTWKILAAVTGGIATVYSTYWDVVIDWGLLQRNSRNSWLRDKLLIPNKNVYYIAMVLNAVLRLAWLQTLVGITDAPFLHRTALIAIVASLEIIRRGIWNFFRLENEHLNNVGKFRAFKSVPLPFSFHGNEERKEYPTTNEACLAHFRNLVDELPKKAWTRYRHPDIRRKKASYKYTSDSPPTGGGGLSVIVVVQLVLSDCSCVTCKAQEGVSDVGSPTIKLV